MQHKCVPKKQTSNLGESGAERLGTQVYLENGTLVLISDRFVALRRLDLESCNVMQLPTAPDFKLYYKTATEESGSQRRLGLQIVAISKRLSPEEEKGDLALVSNVLSEKLSRWSKELELRSDIALQQERIGTGKAPGRTRLPTLLNLLGTLCSDRVTTGEQRKQIRDALNLFLVGEIQYDDVFLVFGQILGEEVLQHLVASLEVPSAGDPGPDFSWMLRSFELGDDLSPLGSLLSYARVQDFLQDFLRLYPLHASASGEVPGVGHSTVTCGPYVIFLGGVKSLPGEESLPSGVSLHGFDEIRVLDTHSLEVSSFSSAQPAPKPTIHHSSNLILAQTGPKILLSGGLFWDQDSQELDFSQTTSLFDMESRTWTVLTESKNTPRFLHASLTYPQASTGSPSKFVVVFGGLTKGVSEISPSNDLWVFSARDNSWTQVAVLPAPNSAQTELPSPRFGHSMSWVAEKTFLVFGGESKTKSGEEDGFVGVLLDDVWSFTITSSDQDIENLNIRGHWTKISTLGSPRPSSSLHVSIALNFPRPNSGAERISCLSPGSDCLPPGSQLLFIGGLESPLVKSYPVRLRREAGSGSGASGQDWLFLGLGDSRPPDGGPGAGVNLSALDLDSKQWRTIRNLRVSSPSPSARAILSPPEELPDLSRTAILKGASCFFETPSTNKNTRIPCVLLQGLFRGGDGSGPGAHELVALSLLGLEPYFSSLPAEPEAGGRRPKEVASHAPDRQAFLDSISPYIRPVPSKHFSVSGSLFASLSSSQRWAFGALAHLVDNALAPEVDSGSVRVSLDRDFISVSDSGLGLSYQDLDRLFRQFGLPPDCGSAAACAPRSSLKMYGLGFKLAFSRLSGSCMVFTKTSSCIGVGLLSKSVVESPDLAESRFWSPICFWHSDTLSPLIPQGSCIQEHNEKQRLILQHGFVRDPGTLGEFFSSIGSATGTKIVFPLSEEFLKLHPSQYVEISDRGMDLASQNLSLTLPESDAPGPCLFTRASEPLSASDLPFWKSRRLSPDYSLATYLSWLYLNNTQEIFCQGRLLPPGRSSESSGLYGLLAKTLKRPAELTRIYKDGRNDGAFALIGKLSEPGDSAAPEPSGDGADPGGRGARILEAGVLLYYKGRLIRRLEGRFPETNPRASEAHRVTAVINVPEWLKPASSKQEFVLEDTGVFEEFQDLARSLVAEYLSVCSDPDALKAWESDFNGPSLGDSDAARPSKIPKLED
ncbi:kelch motif family protein [Cryptosporidium felis]|nr:kelch motif family protein [Cryptosporidium felis]